MYRHHAFGLRWDSDIPLVQFTESPGDDAPADIIVQRASAPLAERTELRAANNARIYADGIRFYAGDEAIIDIYAPDRIEYLPGIAWSGHLPALFYGTLTALLLAWRGGAPVHGSSVEIGGQAYLICGKSGAGKSTLAAALIASGTARLLADDLSSLEGRQENQPPILYPGRAAIRLFPAVADYMPKTGAKIIREAEGSEKQLVLPLHGEPFRPVPLAATLILGGNTDEIPLWRRAAFLDTHAFRPRWMRSIPGWNARFRILHRAATMLPMLSLDLADISDREAFCARADEALIRLRPSSRGFDLINAAFGNRDLENRKEIENHVR